jgi:fructokinase
MKSFDRSPVRLGIDLGGTKIEAIALDSDGVILARDRLATPRAYDATVNAVTDLVHKLEAALNVGVSVGIGTPGSISPESGLMRNANSTWLNGMPLIADLGEALGREVRAANDADCFALSEAVDGAGADADCVFGAILGTGVGGGVVVDGALLRGAQAIAGEWGHNPLPWPSPAELEVPPCWCGKTGCLETWLSGPGLEAAFAREHGREASTYEIADGAAAGHPVCAAALEAYTDRLARGLACVINVLDPDVVVLGGGLSNIDALYAPTQDKLPAYVFSDLVRTRIVKHAHGDSSGVRGAAWLWPA